MGAIFLRGGTVGVVVFAGPPGPSLHQAFFRTLIWVMNHILVEFLQSGPGLNIAKIAKF